MTHIWVLKQSASYILQKAVNMSNEYEIATAALFIIYAVGSSLLPDGAVSVVRTLFLGFFYYSCSSIYGGPLTCQRKRNTSISDLL